jgi:CRP-like cAMP-binding protein
MNADNHPFALWVQRLEAREAFDTLELLAAFGSLDASHRLRHLLASLLRAGSRRQKDGLWRLQVNLTMQDLALALGASREHVSRLVASLTAAGVVRRDRGWFVIPPRSPLLGGWR